MDEEKQQERYAQELTGVTRLLAELERLHKSRQQVDDELTHLETNRAQLSAPYEMLDMPPVSPSIKDAPLSPSSHNDAESPPAAGGAGLPFSGTATTAPPMSLSSMMDTTTSSEPAQPSMPLPMPTHNGFLRSTTDNAPSVIGNPTISAAPATSTGIHHSSLRAPTGSSRLASAAATTSRSVQSSSSMLPPSVPTGAVSGGSHAPHHNSHGSPHTARSANAARPVSPARSATASHSNTNRLTSVAHVPRSTTANSTTSPTATTAAPRPVTLVN